MKVIWVNGCFDVLHRGHLQMLKYARNLGDMLVVGIDFDHRVKSAKGPQRPFNTFTDRKYMLESLRTVDLVVGYGTDKQLIDHIKHFTPEVMVVGSDWKGKRIVGGEFAKSIEFFDRIGNYSTTKILEGK